MKELGITQHNFEELRVLQKQRRWDWPAWFSTNEYDAIRPGVTRGWTPRALREDVRGISKILDDVANEYLRVREEGGRFFISDEGGFYKDENTENVVKFIRFIFRLQNATH